MIEKRPFFFATISLVLGEVVGQYANQMVRIAFYCIGLIGLFVLWYSKKYRKKTKKISRVYKKKGQRMPSALLSFFYILFLIGSIHNQYVQIVFSIPNGYEDGMEVYVIGTIIEKTKTDYGMTYRIQKPKIMKEDLTKKAAKKQTLENRTEQKNKNQPDQKEIDQLYQEETCSETTQAILGEKTEKEEGGQEQLRGDLLLYGLEEELELGQLIFAYGQLQTLAEPTNPGQFNQKKYQMARGVLGTIKKAKVKQKSVQGNAMIESIWKVREKINNGYRLVLDEKSAGLLMAMVTGERGMVDSEIKTLYQNQGIAHILAISGLHVAFVGRSVFRILRKRGISYGIAGSVAISFLCVYSIFVGKSASVVRGCIMLTMLLIGEIIGRSYDMITAMALAAVLLILENPYCIEDIGFLLSFGAIVGISICYPYYFSRKDRKHKKFPQNLDTKRGEQSRAKYWKNNKREEIKRKESENNNSDSHWDKEKQRKPYRVIKEQIGQLKEEKINKKTGEIIINKQNRRSWIRRQKESILVSLSIQMVTLPILLTSFYGFSPYSIFLNLFILPMMSLLLPSAMFGGIMTLCSFFWAKILLYPAVFVLHSYEWICRFMEQIPSSFVITGAPSIKFYLVYYMLLILGAILWKKRKKKELFFSFFLGVMIILIDWQGEILARLPHSNTMITSKKLKILCADVGQGDGIVLKLPSKHYYLLDGGSTDVKNVGTYRLLPLLKYYGISTLEGAFVTHFDSDHYNGMQQLFGNIRIKKLFLPKLIEKDEEYIQFEQLAKSYHTEIFYVAEGDRLQDGTVSFHWLSPSLSNQKEDKNDNSQVFEIRYGKFQGLFTGDMGEEREQEILSSLSPCTFLKVGHHGSKYSSSEAFLQRIKPKYGVISYGVGNERTTKMIQA